MTAAVARIAVKVVPGASRDRIVGVHGDALKVQVAAPPEAGKANERLCEILAAALGIPARDVVVVGGHRVPRKIVGVRGLALADARQRLGMPPL